MDSNEAIVEFYSHQLHIPEPLHDVLFSLLNKLKSLQKKDIYGLCHEEAEAYYSRFAKQYGDIELLAIYLLVLPETERLYKERGINEEVFMATMGCFSRFINETYRKFGTWTFDRHFWTYRQTSLRLFRLGELEFEFGENEIAIHIPSDAKLDRFGIDKSIALLKEFQEKHFPDSKTKKVCCSSWLLSKQILSMLDHDSGITTFASYFDIKQGDPCQEVYFWLFDCKDPMNLDALKENTSLQRKAKAFLLGGGIIYEGIGILKEEFL